MKLKFHLVPIVLGALLTVAHADNTPASLLTTNPGFEDGIAGWSLKDTDIAAKLSQVLPEAAHTGKMGLRVEQKTTQFGQWIASSPVTVVPQKKYQVSFWVRTLAESHAAVYMKFLGANGTNSIDTAKPPANMFQIPGGIYDWTEYQFEAQAPAGAVSAVIAVHAYTNSECKADFDDFSVVPVAP